MPVRSFLITGATGATGGHTARLLIDRGHQVRAFVHRQDDRAARLAQLGAEIVVGDLLDLDSVGRALEGIESAYFVYPIREGLVEASAYFAQAAGEARLRAIVNMSQRPARREAKSNAARQHWISERLLDRSGVPATHVRPTLFAEWLLYYSRTIGTDGLLPLPFAGGRHAPIAARDQAHVIAAILEAPAAHAGQTYPLFGPLEMDHGEIAAVLSRVLRRPVRYEPLAIEEFARRMASAPPHLVQHLSSIAQDYRDGIFAGTNDVVSRIGRTTPTTVEAFVEAHRASFLPPDHPRTGAPA